MDEPVQPRATPRLSYSDIALLVVDQTPAIVAYIDRDQHYRFANAAYLDWFGRTREEMVNLTMREVIGPIYEQNLPHTLAALRGELRVFERRVTTPDGKVRHSLMTYKPDIDQGVVRGFFVHVADVSPLKEVELELQAAKEAVEEAARRELSNLQQANATLERLGAIGQEITAQLNARAIAHTLDRHMHALLGETQTAIYLLASDQLVLSKDSVYGDDFEYLGARTIALSDVQDLASRCVRERRQFVAHRSQSPHCPLWRSGTPTMQSLMVAPLLVGDRVLGVMVTQSPQANAYAEREELIFRALCSYGAIALDNASAYQQLQDTQQQLVYKGKMAALGALVAGVAHELNTPIGNSLLTASAMEAKTESFSQKIRDDNLRRSDLTAFVAMTQQSNELILRGLHTAANLVRSFKQIAVDRSSEIRRHFNLRSFCEELLAIQAPGLDVGKHALVLAVPADLQLDSYPETLGQVLDALIENALTHAFENRTGGQVTISARLLSRTHVELTVHDNGVGIAPQHLERVFDPFFTTKMGRGSNGLGLNVCYNMVTSILNGSIQVRSILGAGTTFYLELPLGAP